MPQKKYSRRSTRQGGKDSRHGQAGYNHPAQPPSLAGAYFSHANAVAVGFQLWLYKVMLSMQDARCNCVLSTDESDRIELTDWTDWTDEMDGTALALGRPPAALTSVKVNVNVWCLNDPLLRRRRWKAHIKSPRPRPDVSGVPPVPNIPYFCVKKNGGNLLFVTLVAADKKNFFHI